MLACLGVLPSVLMRRIAGGGWMCLVNVFGSSCYAACVVVCVLVPVWLGGHFLMVVTLLIIIGIV